MEKFKPNLIPNNKKGIQEVFDAIEANGGIQNYRVLRKKDGVRIEAAEELLGRSLKPIRSVHANVRFRDLPKIATKNAMVLEGEFYCHGMKFNEINRFISNTDVTSAKELKKLEKMKLRFFQRLSEPDADGNQEEIFVKPDEEFSHEDLSLIYPTELEYRFPNRDIEWLTTFHEDLRFWVFDAYFEAEPKMKFSDRITAINRILAGRPSLDKVLTMPQMWVFSTIEDMIAFYERSLEDGWEGLVLVHRDHVYKTGRSTHKEGMLLKLKDENNRYDGVILAVEEGTAIKEGIARKKNELGRSVTSKYQDDREPSGMAKGFVVEFEGLGTFTVGLKGFDNSQKVKLLENKEKYIGRHFIYTGMPPVKDFPRHAYFKEWRDEK